MAEETTIHLRTFRQASPERIDAAISRSQEGSAGDHGGLTEAQTPSGRHQFSLPPADGGKDAWLFLASCFAVEALVWGFPFSFGVFESYYRNHEPFSGSGNIAVIGTCAMGVMYLTAPFTFPLLRLYPRQTRWTPVLGLLLMCLSLALSSLSKTVTQLIATQGVLYAVGGSVAYTPCILYMDEWFVRRKGLAYGIMWSGTGLAGVVLPLLLQHLLSAYGYQTTLRVWACAVFVLTVPLAYFIRPRIPVSAASAVTKRRPVDLRFPRPWASSSRASTSPPTPEPPSAPPPPWPP
ncbi:hypothetical protein VTK73DRAFT_2856 [Phialemonium thermophilum]|uniref:Major Facilitator Superfamily protein n=1 Tax=Phialemonium thermophilum TaxID=223376 RepID=A0ABR3VR25_9PEZI